MSTAPVYPSVPAPTANVQSLWQTVMAQKQVIEILLGLIGQNQANAAVTWGDLVTLGLIKPGQVPPT